MTMVLHRLQLQLVVEMASNSGKRSAIKHCGNSSLNPRLYHANCNVNQKVRNLQMVDKYDGAVEVGLCVRMMASCLNPFDRLAF